MPHRYWRLAGLLFSCLLVSVFAAACRTIAPTPTPTPAPTLSPAEIEATAEAVAEEIAAAYPLAATAWELEYFGPAKTSTAPLSDTRVSVTYFWDRYMGYDGCNWFLGVYSTDTGGELHMMQPLKTRDICEPEEVYEQSLYFAGALLNATAYAHEGEQLIISTTNDQKLLALSPATPAPMLSTEWDVKLWGSDDRAQWYPVFPTSNTSITFGKDGQASGSGGCNNYTVTYQGDLQIEKVMTATDTYAELPTLVFGPVAAQISACDEPQSIMEQEQAFFISLGSTAYYFKLGGMLMLMDANGVPLLMLAASS